MLHKTRGIVLTAIRHTETSLICKIYTERFGLQSYLIYGARKPRAKISAAILQPMHLLDLVVYHKTNGTLQKMAEAQQVPLFERIPYDIEKRTIMLFLAEVLNKVIKNEEADAPLFEFIYTMIVWYDRAEGKERNFHLFFLLKLTQYLGVYPDQDYWARTFKRGGGVQEPSLDVDASTMAGYWDCFLRANVGSIKEIKLNTFARRQLLRHIIDYYQEHVGAIEPLKSQAVLESIWE